MAHPWQRKLDAEPLAISLPAWPPLIETTVWNRASQFPAISAMYIARIQKIVNDVMIKLKWTTPRGEAINIVIAAFEETEFDLWGEVAGLEC